MIKLIRTFLVKLIDDIDTGNTYLTSEEQLELLTLLKDYYNKEKPMSKYMAYTYLNVSRAKFDNMVKEGIIPEGVKLPSFKEKFFYKKDLDKVIKNK